MRDWYPIWKFEERKDTGLKTLRGTIPKVRSDNRRGVRLSRVQPYEDASIVLTLSLGGKPVFSLPLIMDEGITTRYEIQ